MKRSGKLDWPRLVEDLRQNGMPLAGVDRNIGEYKGFTAHLVRGEVMEPKFSQGYKLVELHARLMGPEKTAELMQ